MGSSLLVPRLEGVRTHPTKKCAAHSKNAMTDLLMAALRQKRRYSSYASSTTPRAGKYGARLPASTPTKPLPASSSR